MTNQSFVTENTLRTQSIDGSVATTGIAMYVSFMSFMTFDILMLWPAERSVYLRDQVSGMYCTSAFFIARSFAELPTHTLAGLIGGIITYYMYGLSTDADNVLMFFFISIVT